MNWLFYSLFLIPLIVSGLILVLPKKINQALIIITAAVLSGISLYLFGSVHQSVALQVPDIINQLVAGVDILLLLYFGFIAVKHRNVLVGILSILQLAGVVYALSIAPHHSIPQFYIDRLSLMMFLLINIVSGIIAIYAIRYIDEEHCSEGRKKFFLSVIMWFIGVMNMIVSADNLEYFFLFFELTTLASFLLIGFRKDEISIRNALNALWMNQIGGVAILGAIIYAIYTPEYQQVTFSGLLNNVSATGLLLPFALLAVAALIKGAQMPFSSWLLGAMVAPTPVSALLHSSTMVKIAPFVILRISPAIKDTQVATVIMLLTAFVFLVAAISALSQDTFKRILAYSTISLLGLMCLLAAAGSETAITAALLLIIFHGVSKCMLFLNAGIIEHVYHYKETSQMDRLGELGPFTALAVAIGFMSLLLPPFGGFIGKWFSIESIGSALPSIKLTGALIIAAMAIGGAVMALLYFKVTGVLFARSGEQETIRFENTHPLYRSSIIILLFLIIGGMLALPFLIPSLFAPVASAITQTSIICEFRSWALYLNQLALPLIPMLIAFLVLPLTIIVSMFIHFRRVDRVKEYTCGEKVEYRFSSLYFSTEKAMPYYIVIGGIFFVALVFVGGML
ncbi:MAG TPA: proton-conducting transporter membrane subunit [Bacteroidales bacterium]|nr:proton-conducting transporter membrane subunit [Bacteroidales bacterium]HOK97946.1 proton-conducting transporter membrane subunit [Bacteroidales bacterium]HPO64522.1 proton-conducting transporter membrane subunit [Bacteroidales bacterium]